jgi:hypothetical protein
MIPELVFFLKAASRLRHFLDHGFSGWGPEKRAYVLSCPTNRTSSSAIYKLRIRLAEYLNFKELVSQKFIIRGLVFLT